MFKLQSLTKEVGELTAVDSVDFEAPMGQMPGVVGRSGGLEQLQCVEISIQTMKMIYIE